MRLHGHRPCPNAVDEIGNMEMGVKEKQKVVEVAGVVAATAGGACGHGPDGVVRGGNRARRRKRIGLSLFTGLVRLFVVLHPCPLSPDSPSSTSSPSSSS
eukprot:1355433-Rhodomonas_salina.2